MARDASASENQTIVEPWNITALKAYLEEKINSLGRETDLKFETRDKALKHQFLLDQAHFGALNNEAARLLKNVEITVSRDMWDVHLRGDREWKTRIELAVHESMSKHEFQIYKESTERALNVGSGKSQGVLQLVSFCASLAAIGAAVYAITK